MTRHIARCRPRSACGYWLRTLALALVAWVAAMSPLRADDATPEGLMARLIAASSEERPGIEAEITALGPGAISDLLRHLPPEVTPEAETSLASSFEAMGVEPAIAEILACRSEWKKTRERPAHAILARLRAARSPKLTQSVPLKRDVLTRFSLVPPYADQRLDGFIPASLAGTKVAVRITEKGLEIDLEGDGRFRTKVDTKKPRVVRIGDRRKGRPFYAARP